jgi:hypothetical protein
MNSLTDAPDKGYEYLENINFKLLVVQYGPLVGSHGTFEELN